MKSSQLTAIIRRLEAMVEDKDNEVQVRRFEKNGEERCLITYDTKAETFELEEHETNQVYKFDDIDLIAIEIYELLQD
ncbi:YkuJ family protein [Pisciglobus halotolerans]|nr:YkuJ family protein [Pisciglobus halotolerans]